MSCLWEMERQSTYLQLLIPKNYEIRLKMQTIINREYCLLECFPFLFLLFLNIFNFFQMQIKIINDRAHIVIMKSAPCCRMLQHSCITPGSLQF